MSYQVSCTAAAEVVFVSPCTTFPVYTYVECVALRDGRMMPWKGFERTQLSLI
jgi:hypothetical protein